MKPKTHRASRRALPLVLSLLVVAVAGLAFAGFATAHHGSGSTSPDQSANAGTIASFDPATGTLVINLTEGGSISGLVTKFTWIEGASNGNPCDQQGEDRRSERMLHGWGWCRKMHRFDWGGGDHGNWGHGDWGNSPNGSTEELVPGAEVEDAVMILKDGKAFFVKIDLAG